MKTELGPRTLWKQAWASKSMLVVLICVRLVGMAFAIYLMHRAIDSTGNRTIHIVARVLFVLVAILSLAISWNKHNWTIDILTKQRLFESETARVVFQIGAQVLMLVMLDWSNPYLVAVEMLFTAMTLSLLVSFLLEIRARKTHVA